MVGDGDSRDEPFPLIQIQLVALAVGMDVEERQHETDAGKPDPVDQEEMRDVRLFDRNSRRPECDAEEKLQG